MSFIKKIVDGNQRQVKRMQRLAGKIQALGKSMSALSDLELKEKTAEFKERLSKGETLDDILVEAFAVVREAAQRVLGMYPYPVQIIGGITLHEGNIAEMRTGEGKTLTSTLPVYLNALAGKGVHVVTVNEYLASRDAEEMGKVHEFLGLTVGINLNSSSPEEKRAAYEADITYTTNSELGFDYLRDNMVLHKEEKVQRPLSFAVVDEVDSILVDEARTPLIISGQSEEDNMLYLQADAFVHTLKKDVDYTHDIKTKNVSLTDKGINRAENRFGIENLFDLQNVLINHHISQALKAIVTMQKDVDYVIYEGEIVIVDQFTGRMMEGRRYNEGLHQAIEAKEGLHIQGETITMATITFQNFFRMYEKLSGMTGTAKTEEEEFRNIYNMQVVSIPTNRPIARIDQADAIFKTMEGKFNAVVADVATRHEKGQPILIGTVAIETSEYMSNLLTRKGISHNVLNAKNHASEAEIIAGAGQMGAVTIATNMAGRGTDIKLGTGVKELGGLAVIGTERHESRRIDNQLRGRSGRQGDMGSSQFYLSLEDDLMKRFGSDRLASIMERFGVEDDQAIESPMVSKSVETAQRRVEGNNFDARKQLLQYDDVLRQQREVMYEQRNKVLEKEKLTTTMQEMLASSVKRAVEKFTPIDEIEEDWNLDALVQHIDSNMLEVGEVKVEDLQGLASEEIVEKITEKVLTCYNEKANFFPDGDMSEFERVVLLKAIDNRWTAHIDQMDHLRQGIHLQQYGQIDPLREYQIEGFAMFDTMIETIEDDLLQFVMKTQIVMEVEFPEEMDVEMMERMGIKLIEGMGMEFSEGLGAEVSEVLSTEFPEEMETEEHEVLSAEQPKEMEITPISFEEGEEKEKINMSKLDVAG